MSPQLLTLTRYDGGHPPTYKGSWMDIPLNVTLDTSAVLKLAGHVDVPLRNTVLEKKFDTVLVALRRLAEMGQIDTSQGHAEMMLSALDLD
jgi:hypothetical protein